MTYREYSETIRDIYVLRGAESGKFFVDPDYKYEMIVEELTPSICEDKDINLTWDDVREILTLEAARLNAVFDMSMKFFETIDDFYEDKVKPSVDEEFTNFKDKLYDFIKSKVEEDKEEKEETPES